MTINGYKSLCADTVRTLRQYRHEHTVWRLRWVLMTIMSVLTIIVSPGWGWHVFLVMFVLIFSILSIRHAHRRIKLLDWAIFNYQRAQAMDELLGQHVKDGEVCLTQLCRHDTLMDQIFLSLAKIGGFITVFFNRLGRWRK